MSIRTPISRREALRSLGLGLALPLIPRSLWIGEDRGFAIRTITAGINLSAPDDLATFESTAAFLEDARRRYEDLGYTVQTIRVATQPFGEYAGHARTSPLIDRIRLLDDLARERNVILNIGPVIVDDRFDVARLFPIPGKGPGDAISFENPFLTDGVVMPLA